MQHRLTNKNTENKTGDCSVCGLNVPILYRPGRNYWHCKTQHKKHTQNQSTKRRKRAIVELHPNPGYCEICGSKENNLCIDHDHKTGALRGWLCKTCNSGIGMLKDDIETLKNAIKYLETRKPPVE